MREGKKVGGQLLRYRLFVTPFGEGGMVWEETSGRLRVMEILLPLAEEDMAGAVQGLFPGAFPGASAAADELADALGKAARGEAVPFRRSLVNLEGHPPFQRAVLEACRAIGRGRVRSYGDLARSVGVPRGARAVGQVMASNPYPLIVPCHRVVRSDGTLGGFGGGLSMKKALLLSEGVPFSGDAVDPAAMVSHGKKS
jgi:methylated-DNA-[protein]-cysteine S-methyltransferase